MRIIVIDGNAVVVIPYELINKKILPYLWDSNAL